MNSLCLRGNKKLILKKHFGYVGVSVRACVCVVYGHVGNKRVTVGELIHKGWYKRRRESINFKCVAAAECLPGVRERVEIE